MHFFHATGEWLPWHSISLVLLAVLVVSRFLVCRRQTWSNLRKHFPALTAFVELLLAPLSVVLLFTAFEGCLRVLPLNTTDAWLNGLFNFTFCLTASWYLARGIHFFISQRYVTKKRPENGFVATTALLRGGIYTLCLLFGLFLYLRFQGYSLTGMWVSTGLATALIGFALRQPLGDFFSGVALSMEKSFRLGDWLQLENGVIGQVIDINWRATWLRDWDNTTHIIPNAQLSAQDFKNYHGEYQYFKPWYYIKLPAEIDPRFVKELLIEAIYRCKSILKDPPPVVRLTDASTQPYTYMMWVCFPNYPAMFKGREELFREVHYVLERAGIHPATPIKEWRTRKATIPAAEPPTVQLALKSLDLFATLSDEEIEHIAQCSSRVHYDAGSSVFKEGDRRDSFDIVTSGAIASQVKSTKGEPLFVGELTAGQYFGLSTMLTGQPSLFEYIAKTDVSLIRVSIDCMKDILGDHPELSDKYAAIIKQRLDDAELMRLSTTIPEQKSTTGIKRIKRLIRYHLGRK